MKAIVQDRYGAPQRVLKLEEVDRPPVGDDDVLIRVRATSVNTPDWITVAGVPYVLRLRFGLRRPPTPVRGTDVAGVVEAVGDNVTDLQPGDDVFGSAWDDTLATRGTFAELAVVPAAKLIKKPTGLTFEEAGASGMSGLTAMIAMRDVGKVGPGTRVLINGASGGVGTFAVQIAKALGAEVTGVCSTPNLELVRSLGADHVIDYTQEDFTRGEQRYDVILDNVIGSWMPIILFTIVFGLSMDYHMLLLNRIKEAYDEGQSNDESVSVGIRMTAGQITGAAAIMVGVFGTFALGRSIDGQEFGLGLGLGLGVAVLIDATLIRSVLLPASMKLLGDWNWYLPDFLSWLPDLRVEVAEPTEAAASAD